MSNQPHAALPTGWIAALDGFRAVAILMVMLFHFYSRFASVEAGDLYPYGEAYADFPFFKHGYLGVQFFFMISGFVIAMTLARSRDWADFAIKRFARLFPAMLLCSVLTFAGIKLLEPSLFEVHVVDFIPGLTFLSPGIWQRILGREVGLIDGAYWTLFIEVRFYALACVLHFGLRKAPLLLTVGVASIVMPALVSNLRSLGWHDLAKALDFFLVVEHLPWFAAGLAFWFIAQRELVTVAVMLAVSCLLQVATPDLIAGNWAILTFKLIFFTLFSLLVHVPEWLSIFAWRPLALIGAASYSLYLLHQNLGVTLIAAIARRFDLVGTDAAALPVIVSAGFVVACMLIYRYWEAPARRLVNGWWSRQRNARGGFDEPSRRAEHPRDGVISPGATGRPPRPTRGASRDVA